jgi:hypothetical protein
MLEVKTIGVVKGEVRSSLLGSKITLPKRGSVSEELPGLFVIAESLFENAEVFSKRCAASC